MKINILVFTIIILTLNADEFNIDAILEASTEDVNNTQTELVEFVKDSKKSSTKAQKEFYDKYQYVPEPVESTSTNNDLKNSCYANVENKLSWCYAIQNEDMKNNCYANVENKLSWCYAIQDEDMKNSCYANVENKVSWCYAIQDEDMKNSCYANVENKLSWCYAIQNEDIKNSCYANVENKLSWCYSISK